MNWFKVHAPVDAIVKEIAPSHSEVPSGQLLLELSSPELDRFDRIVACFRKALEIAERPLIDGRADDLLADIPNQIAAVQAVADMNNVKPHPASGSYAIAREEALKQIRILQITQKHAPKRISDAKEILRIAKAQLVNEQNYLQEIRSLLTISAKQLSVVRAHVARGSFVKHGEICLEIQQ